MVRNRRSSCRAVRALTGRNSLRRSSSGDRSWRRRRTRLCGGRRRRVFLPGKHGSNKEKKCIPLGFRSVRELRRTMLEENNKCKGEDRKQNQPQNKGKQGSHGKKPGLIPKPRRNDAPEGMVSMPIFCSKVLGG